jgi:glycerate kinase
MHVLIAPNAFKHALSATDAANAIAAGLAGSRFNGSWATCPVGDGGDGTGELLVRHAGGYYMPAIVRDPLGCTIPSRLALIDGGRAAVIELADASGLKLLRTRELDPLQTTTFGTGELISRALDCGVEEIVICIGGSATVDAGSGLLRALGFRFRDAAGNVLASPGSLVELRTIDRSGVDARLANCRLTVVCDVTNALVGDRGAAKIFGPQKGASSTSLQILEAALERFADLVSSVTGKDVGGEARGGAAGGVAAALWSLLGATLVGGIDYVLDRVGFDAAVAKADLVITGEGSIDEQTVDGKGPWGVAIRARRRGAFVVGFAGRVPLHAHPNLREGFDALIPIGHSTMNLEEALSCTSDNLRRSAIDLGNLLALCESRSSQADLSVLSSTTMAQTK